MGDHLASQYGKQRYHRNCAIRAFSLGVDGEHFAYFCGGDGVEIAAFCPSSRVEMRIVVWEISPFCASFQSVVLGEIAKFG